MDLPQPLRPLPPRIRESPAGTQEDRHAWRQYLARAQDPAERNPTAYFKRCAGSCDASSRAHPPRLVDARGCDGGAAVYPYFLSSLFLPPPGSLVLPNWGLEGI